MVKIVISNVLFDTGKKMYLYKTLEDWSTSVPAPTNWLSRSFYVLSDLKRVPAEVTLSHPSTSLCCLTVFVFVCDIHLIVFNGLIPMIYFEYNKTNDHYKEKIQHAKWGFYAFIDTIMWIYNEIKKSIFLEETACCY